MTSFCSRKCTPFQLRHSIVMARPLMASTTTNNAAIRWALALKLLSVWMPPKKVLRNNRAVHGADLFYKFLYGAERTALINTNWCSFKVTWHTTKYIHSPTYNSFLQLELATFRLRIRLSNHEATTSLAISVIKTCWGTSEEIIFEGVEDQWLESSNVAYQKCEKYLKVT